MGETTRMILARILSVPLAAKLNWAGQGKKTGLRHFKNVVLVLQCTLLHFLRQLAPSLYFAL